jgi:hypothetical protein
MHKLNKIEKKIRRIGKKMVKCRKQCKGVTHNLKEGIIPRCLWFDTYKKKNNKGCIVVGINPGIPKNKDAQLFFKNEVTLYDKQVKWLKNLTYPYKGTSNYYTKLVNFIRKLLKIKGPILWTELVKCQLKRKGGKLLKDTIRICMKKFLKKELEIIPRKWPIIAIGSKSYQEIQDSNHLVIGIPHSTGPYANKLFDKLCKRKNNTKLKRIKELIKLSNKNTCWYTELTK